jgi:hypothetical protein
MVDISELDIEFRWTELLLVLQRGGEAHLLRIIRELGARGDMPGLLAMKAHMQQHLDGEYMHGRLPDARAVYERSKLALEQELAKAEGMN